jgi:hypothetical protein
VPAEIAYMNTSGNIKTIFDKIRSAGAPPKFTHEFLKANLGFTSSNDRGVTKILRALGFIDDSSIPQPRYHDFRDAAKSGAAMAAGLRDGWAEVFLSDTTPCDKPTSQLKSMFQSLTGKSEPVAEKMASTFKALCALADFSALPPMGTPSVEIATDQAKAADVTAMESGVQRPGSVLALHSDVHVHLPPTTDVAVYTAIFRALKDELLD